MALGTCLNLSPSVSYLWKYLAAACGGHPSLFFSTEGGIFSHFYLPLVILPKIGWRMWEAGVLRKSQVSFMNMIYSFASRLKKTLLGEWPHIHLCFSRSYIHFYIFTYTRNSQHIRNLLLCVVWGADGTLFLMSNSWMVVPAPSAEYKYLPYFRYFIKKCPIYVIGELCLVWMADLKLHM